jgi:hypothetical protein
VVLALALGWGGLRLPGALRETFGLQGVVIDGKSDLSLSIAGVTTGTFYVQEMLHLLVSESACMQVVLGVTAPIIL